MKLVAAHEQQWQLCMYVYKYNYEFKKYTGLEKADLQQLQIDLSADVTEYESVFKAKHVENVKMKYHVCSIR